MDQEVIKINSYSIRLIGLRELYCWAILLLIGDYLLAHLSTPSAVDRLNIQNTLGAFDLLGCAVALWRIRKSEPGPATALETGLVLILSVLGAVAPQLAPAALTVLGGYLLWRPDRNLKAAAAVLLALAAHQLWSRMVFAATAPLLVNIDAALVGEAITHTIAGSTWHDNIIATSQNHAIAVGGPCSSFNNISLALLAWISLTKLERPEWARRDLVVAGLTIGAQVALNVTRLYIMALSYGLYIYWHDGAGAQIYAATASAACVLISVFGARWAASK